MVRNYLKIAGRNLLGQKTYSFINIFGLAVGLACCLLIWLYCQDEFSHDRHHTNVDRICRVLREFRLPNGKAQIDEKTSGALAQALKKEFPQIQQALRFFVWPNNWITYKDKGFRWRFCIADPKITGVFDLPVVKGNLNANNTVAITERMARRYFGDSDQLG